MLIGNSKACYKRKPEVVKYLLEIGADPNLGPGGTAISASFADIILRGDNQYHLYHAAKAGCVETVNLLLDYGAADMSKACLLHADVQSGCTEMIEHILAQGVDVSELYDLHRTGTVYGTPLHRTIASTHGLNAVKLLLAHGASIN
jgi:ankyrin repeat protein